MTNESTGYGDHSPPTNSHCQGDPLSLIHMFKLDQKSTQPHFLLLVLGQH